METPDRARLAAVIVALAVVAVAAIAWVLLPRPGHRTRETAPGALPAAAPAPVAAPLSTHLSQPPSPPPPASGVPAALTAAPAAQPAPAGAAGVAIQDGKTIDFSSGKPVLKDSPEEKALIARSVKEMDEAAQEVTFAPPAKKTAPAK
jgi:hypothetical protein